MGLGDLLGSLFSTGSSSDVQNWRRVHARLDALLAHTRTEYRNPLPSEVTSLIDSGRTIDAIRAYRAATGAELYAARAAVLGSQPDSPDAAIRKLDTLLAKLGAKLPKIDPDPDGEIRRLIEADRKIEAVKLVRESQGLSLSDAKRVVDELAQ